MRQAFRNARQSVVRLRRAAGGLTLIELLIVLSIMGVLASIVMHNVTGMASQGKDRAYLEDRNNMQKAVDTYYANYQSSYPTRNTLPGPTGNIPTNTAYIDFFRLLSIGKLLTFPESAGPWNNVSEAGGFGDSPFIGCVTSGNGSVTLSGSCVPGAGSYSWWVDGFGRAKSQNTQGQTNTFNGRYP